MSRTSSDPIDQALLKHLRRIRTTWNPINWEEHTAAEEQAFGQMIFAGLVEARIDATVSMYGFPEQVRFKACVSGLYEEELGTQALKRVPAWITRDGKPRQQMSCRFDLLSTRLTYRGECAQRGLSSQGASFVIDGVRSTPDAAGDVGIESYEIEEPRVDALKRMSRDDIRKKPEAEASSKADSTSPLVQSDPQRCDDTTTQHESKPRRDESSVEVKSKKRWTCKKAIAAAEAHVKRNVYPGRNALAAIIGCPPSTLTKAIQKSRLLSDAKNARDAGSNPKPGMIALSDKMLAERPSAAQNPAELIIEDDQDDDALLRRLIEAATPDRRASINAMSASEQRELVDAFKSQQKDDRSS